MAEEGHGTLREVHSSGDILTKWETIFKHEIDPNAYETFVHECYNDRVLCSYLDQVTPSLGNIGCVDSADSSAWPLTGLNRAVSTTAPSRTAE